MRPDMHTDTLPPRRVNSRFLVEEDSRYLKQVQVLNLRDIVFKSIYSMLKWMLNRPSVNENSEETHEQSQTTSVSAVEFGAEHERTHDCAGDGLLRRVKTRNIECWEQGIFGLLKS